VSVEHISADLSALASIGGVDDQRLAQVSSHVNGRCHVLRSLVNLSPHAGVGHFAFSIALWLRNACRKKQSRTCVCFAFDACICTCSRQNVAAVANVKFDSLFVLKRMSNSWHAAKYLAFAWVFFIGAAHLH
jgi:hypothetical protein